MTSAKKLLAAGAVLATVGIAGTAAAQNYYVVNDGYYYGPGYYRSYAPGPYYYAPRYYPTGYYYDPPVYSHPGTLGVRLGPFHIGF